MEDETGERRIAGRGDEMEDETGKGVLQDEEHGGRDWVRMYCLRIVSDVCEYQKRDLGVQPSA